ncbi:hypothetical protein SDC9_125044 [bioreactor metagenome]|uniref:Uncharacterized protein n=1 Tax=bioreactor metagenome TaxID=1076179 RepID=A0A645CMC3_9ZZZZ
MSQPATFGSGCLQVFQPLEGFQHGGRKQRTGLDALAAGLACDQDHKERHHKAIQEHSTEKDKRQRPKISAQKEGHANGDDNCHDHRCHHTHIKVFQGFQVGHHTVEQIAPALLLQICRRSGFQGAIEPNPHFGQQTQINRVRYQPFQVAENTARNAKEAHAHNGYL